MKITIITSFPYLFDFFNKMPVISRFIASGSIEINIVNLKDYGVGRHKKIDDTVYGGGDGLIVRADVLGECIDSVFDPKGNGRLFLTSPRGRLFDQKMAFDIATRNKEIVIVTNRFEGIDQRIIDFYPIEEVSIGNYILFGGDIAACVMIEAICRLVPGVLNEKIINNDSLSPPFFENIECDQYTKPEIWKGIKVPEVLTSGNHKEIAKWRSKGSRSR